MAILAMIRINFFLEESTYKGKPSIKVMAEIWSEDALPKHIGYIATKDVDKVLPLIDTADVDVELYGGLDAGFPSHGFLRPC